jgi:hypothetical protein
MKDRIHMEDWPTHLAAVALLLLLLVPTTNDAAAPVFLAAGAALAVFAAIGIARYIRRPRHPA